MPIFGFATRTVTTAFGSDAAAHRNRPDYWMLGLAGGSAGFGEAGAFVAFAFGALTSFAVAGGTRVVVSGIAVLVVVSVIAFSISTITDCIDVGGDVHLILQLCR
jgi:hypothetical protein